MRSHVFYHRLRRFSPILVRAFARDLFFAIATAVMLSLWIGLVYCVFSFFCYIVNSYGAVAGTLSLIFFTLMLLYMITAGLQAVTDYKQQYKTKE